MHAKSCRTVFDPMRQLLYFYRLPAAACAAIRTRTFIACSSLNIHIRIRSYVCAILFDTKMNYIFVKSMTMTCRMHCCIHSHNCCLSCNYSSSFKKSPFTCMIYIMKGNHLLLPCGIHVRITSISSSLKLFYGFKLIPHIFPFCQKLIENLTVGS